MATVKMGPRVKPVKMATTIRPMAAKPPNIKAERMNEKSLRVISTTAVITPNSTSVAKPAVGMIMGSPISLAMKSKGVKMMASATTYRPKPMYCVGTETADLAQELATQLTSMKRPNTISQLYRPAVTISVLAAPGDVEVLADIIMRETTTFGVRLTRSERRCLLRETIMVQTRYGELSVKVGYLGGEVVTVAPEYEDCRHTAQEHNVPLKVVYAAVLSAANELWGQEHSEA